MPLKRWFFLGVLLALGPCWAGAQTIFNCSSFATTGTCGVGSGQPFGPYGYTVSGGVIDFVPSGSTHNGNALFYNSVVNDRAFTSTITFVPNGFNFSFVVQNCNQSGCGDGQGQSFAAGAGCEGGFYQGFAYPGPFPNNVFAAMLDSYSGLPAGSGTFTYSSTQIYQSNQSPCNPNDGSEGYYGTNKNSTTPVPLNSPAGTPATTTGDTYSATFNYSGSTFTIALYDVTAGGTCTPTSSATCSFTTYNGVYLPAIVGGTTAYVGFTSGIGETTTYPLDVLSFAYTVNAPTAGSAPTAWNAGSTYNNGTISVASPVMSVAPGTYGSPQSVSLSTSTGGAYICYTTSTTFPALTPQPDNYGGCQTGSTLYTGPVSIASSTTLYAMAGIVLNSSTSAGGNPPSTLVAAAYTISAARTTTRGKAVLGGKVVLQ
jgi:hypothetical protein